MINYELIEAALGNAVSICHYKEMTKEQIQDSFKDFFRECAREDAPWSEADQEELIDDLYTSNQED